MELETLVNTAKGISIRYPPNAFCGIGNNPLAELIEVRVAKS